jgi:hypothetical protein
MDSISIMCDNKIVDKNCNDLKAHVYLCTEITGKFENQLFMIFNLMSLSKDYNKKFQLYFDESCTAHKYDLFKNLNFNKITPNNLKEFEIYN